MCLAALMIGGVATAAAAGPCSGGDIYFAAHEDDTLLFQSPALLEDIQAGHCVQTVFLTAGDSGRPASYWEGRETGAEVAYAQMAGVANNWSVKSETVNGHSIHFATLQGKPISIAYLRLPDGGVNGEGFAPYGEQSLMRLWDSEHPPGEGESPITSIEAVDDSTSYSYEGLIATLRSLIESFAPQEIATQNYTVPFKGPDHADHVGTGKFVKAAQSAYGPAHLMVGYEDYETANKAENVPPGLLASKSAVFYAYGAHDDEACASELQCAPTSYAKWLKRQYVAAEESTPRANAGQAQTVVPGAAVKLNGSASFDPGGSPLQYEWTQTAGPKVTLSGATTATPSLTAPGSPATLTFSLVVDNGTHESLPASIAVTVANPAPPAPGPGPGGPPAKPPVKENIVVKLSQAKVRLVVGKHSRHLVQVIAPAKTAVRCRGALPKGARCRVTVSKNVVIEGSKAVRTGGIYHLVIYVAGGAGAFLRPLTVVFRRA